MTLDQLLIFLILGITIVLFIWDRWRHDIVALFSLLACVLVGLIPAELAFNGFGHPAVITVACVLVLSQALQTTGAIDVLAHKVLPSNAGPTLTITALTAFAAVLSGFMNNVGVLALLMPMAIPLASRINLAPGQVLMPLAFGSMLGGMTTLIGTPPNLIISSFRAEVHGQGFAMFDFAGPGIAVTLAGVLFIGLLGWRFVPVRQRADLSSFETSKYLTEVRIKASSKFCGSRLRELERSLDELDSQVVGIVRNKYREHVPSSSYQLKENDILVIEAEPETLGKLLSSLELALEDSADTQLQKEQDKALAKSQTDIPPSKEKTLVSPDVSLIELTLLPNSDLIGRTAVQIQMRRRFNIHLLALSRHGNRSVKRVRRTRFQAGDVILMQGNSQALQNFATDFGCVPLAERQIQVPDKRKTLLASGFMLAAVLSASVGLLPAAVAFAAGMLLIMAFHVIPLRKVYSAIDWPVIVLLGCLIPVAGAMSSTGAGDLLAVSMLDLVGKADPQLTVISLLILTIVLTSFLNNAATAAMMCPIAISLATQLDVNPDTLLMTIAIGASCAFLTPIGHQNNTLILGPGGFSFTDYWQLGLPMQIVVLVVGVPALLFFWPL
ncbi:SLC13 family permease [Alishewanella sp. HL-SH06]|uniref:SLC13 family permease n=1 Tax=Alishewanella sp. HL-SH06 TaxID=3461144 RepID=UPI0040411A46